MNSTRQLGKFEGCADQELGQKIYELTMEGCDAELGEVESFGWYGLLLNVDGKNYIVSEDNNGFFDYTEYDTIDEVTTAWDNLASEYEDFNKDTL